MKFICALTVLILWITISASNGSCQTAHTNKFYKDSVKVPVKLVDDCIHYKIDKEFYEYVADSVSWVAVEMKKEIKEIKRNRIWLIAIFSTSALSLGILIGAR